MRVIENTNITTNLLKNLPKELLGKLNISWSTQSDTETIEVIVLYGESYEKVNEYVKKIGGQLDNLGYGFGIVTIDVKDLITLVKSPDIQYIELPKSLYFSDVYSNRAACVDRARNDYNLDGTGIVIGFIDTGIDYTHPAFLKEDGTTRIEYIYDLSLNGAVYSKEQINTALKSSDPFSIVPSQDIIEHGTHVAGIACAGGNINPDYYGVAPKSSIMMVKTARGNFALSTQIMRGLRFLVEKSKEINMPLVVNMSLSTNDGAHDGNSLLEQYVNTIATLERVTIVIAAGNEGEAQHHVGGEIGDEVEIRFNVAEDETVVVLNLYKSVLPQISIELITPSGVSTGEILVEEGYREGVISGNRYQIYDTGPKSFDISGEIGISLISGGNYILSGVWTIMIRVKNEYKGIFDMWLPILEGLNQKTKFLNSTIDNTLGIPATTLNVISVGSYNPITRSISSFSGRGRITLYGESKPDVVAPGENITAPVPNRSFDKKSGTSMATPHVSGIAALMMQWGILKGNDAFLYGDRLKRYLISGAKKERSDVTYPDPSWGYGEVCAYNTFSELSRVLNIVNINPNFNRQRETVEQYFQRLLQSSERIGVLVEYSVKKRFLELNNLPDVSAVTLNESFGAVYLPINKIPEIRDYVKDIYQEGDTQVYTLNSISPIEASNVINFQDNPYLSLTGKDVILAVLDTGIDYLNTEFQKEDDTTRIISIWDQNIESDKEVYGIKLGTEYTSEQINQAIQLQKSGGDPYSIVPSKDENGHGTMVAGLVGARGKNKNLRSPAPDGDFIIVKLREAGPDALAISGVTKPGVLGYMPIDIEMAFRYISIISSNLKRPMVILCPFGTNGGYHNGKELISEGLDVIANQAGVVPVVGTGNEGDTDTHTDGVIKNKGETQTIELRVGKNQSTLFFSIWVEKPDIMSLSIVSPSGESIDRIPATLDNEKDIKFVYEGTSMRIRYYLTDRNTGSERIVISAINLREGIWRFNLYGDYIVTGRYYSWIPQRSLLDPDTKFLNPSPYITLTVPSTGESVVSVAYYNQNNESIVGASGRGYPIGGSIKPTIAAGGVNANVIRPNNQVGLATGSSVAMSIVAGVCALILEWAIVDGNDRDIGIQEIITYLVRGARKRGGDTYPNSLWGYGMVDMQGVIDAIRGEYRIESKEEEYEEFYIGGLFVRKPLKIFHN